jgi:hypothetical protein
MFASQTGAYSLFDVSVDGSLAWVPGSVADAPRQLVWTDRDGRMWPAISESRRFWGASISPDGQSLATSI